MATGPDKGGEERCGERRENKKQGTRREKHVSALLDLGLLWKETAVIRLEGAFSIPQKKVWGWGWGGAQKKGWGWGT